MFISFSVQALEIFPGEIAVIIAFILCQNNTLHGWLRGRLDSLQQVGILLMNELEEG
jgi:hypothetical protein